MLQTERPGRSRYSKGLGKRCCTATNRNLSWVYFMKKMLSHHTDLAPPLKVLSSSPGQDMPSVTAGHILWELTVQILESNKLLSNVRSAKGFTSLSLPSFLFLMSKYVTLIFFLLFYNIILY